MAQVIGESVRGADPQAEVTLLRVADDAAAQAQLRSGAASAWLHRDAAGWVLTAEDEVDEALRVAASAAIRDSTLAANARAAGTSMEELTAGSRLRVTTVNEADAEQQGVAQVAGLIMTLLFYMATLMFGIALAGSVVEEKQSRIVEIIAASIPVRSLLAGKVLGNLLLALAQMTLFAAVSIVAVRATEFADYLPSISAGMGWFLVFFVAGFVMIAALFAVAGSLASRSEDVQSTAQPVTLFTIVVFLVGFLATGSVAQVLSYVPPFSAVLMPGRVIGGSAAWWQAGLALVLLGLAAALVVQVAARLYSRALLQTSGKLSYRAAWTAKL